MKKDELKSLLTEMYEELMQKVDAQESVLTAPVVTYLQDAAATIQNTKYDSDSSIESIEHSKLAFTNDYKEIAHQSILQYKSSNGRFEQLAQIHRQALDEYADIHINVPSINLKFNEIQIHMMNEVKRANEVISDLTTRIKELERSSNLDSLTKVFNRRALTTYLTGICTQEDLKHEIYLLILDIDDFKIINDTYGHIAGDKILIFLSNILRKTLRDGDKVFRYGGEEFVIVLNRITSKESVEITNRILKLVRSNRLLYQGDSLKVTISIGLTKYCHGDTPDSIIHRADKALYKSKQNGKDQMNMENIDGI